MEYNELKPQFEKFEYQTSQELSEAIQQSK